MNTNQLKEAANTIRMLAADTVQKANSGHPGMPMGCADFTLTLWNKYMKFNPADTNWLGRDRFVLSAGHGSSLLYTMMHLYNYGVSMDDLKNFRQVDSPTAGHPEYGHIPGIEVTTGPLGSGFASGVGMAMANKNFKARTGLDKTTLVDNKIYIIVGDGCMMEGTTHEAASLAGMQKLDNVICFYDDNSITIEGSTDIAFTEDVGKRFEAYDWRVITIENANDIEQCDKALEEALVSDGRPVLLIGKTKIGFGSPNKEGTHDCHGAPLGKDEIIATKKALGLTEEEFYVSDDIRSAFNARAEELKSEAKAWEVEYSKALEDKDIDSALIAKLLSKEVPANLLEELKAVTPTDKAVASRASSGAVLQKVAELVPALVGGSADLSPSNCSDIKTGTSFSPANRAGMNFHFGVRELGMALATNGMALYGTAIPYSATFFVFSDYMKPAIRLAALMEINQVYILTHDSFYVGEDGPTHQPIEQLLMLRSIPGMTVIRPAEANEVAHAWNTALRTKGPVALVLTRQNLEPLSADQADKIDMTKGAYILSDDQDAEVIMLATGSEVNLSLSAADLLRKKGKKVRVVSMPSVEIFEKQSAEYKESILPKSITKRVSVEAASTIGWGKYTGLDGLNIGMDHFGASGPANLLAEKFGFTPAQVADKVLEIL